MIKIGDRIMTRLSQDYGLVGTIISVLPINGTGDYEIDENKVAAIKLEIDWGEFGKSIVMAHDQNISWFKYSDSN